MAGGSAMISGPGVPLLPCGTFFGRAEGERQAGWFTCAHLVPTVPEPAVERHTHSDAHFVLVLAGHYLSTAVGAPGVGGPGTLIYNPPGTTHRDRFSGPSGRFFTVSVPAGVLDGVTNALALPDHAVAPGPAVCRRALRMADRVRSGTNAPALELEALGLELLDLVADERVQRGAAPMWLARARALLRDECDADHTLGDVARRVGVHPVHLTRAFRRYFRTTPGGFLRRSRLNRAAALLMDRRWSLAEIGPACGYFDQAHFCRSFKRAFGLSPRAYRSLSGSRPAPNPLR